MINDRQFILTRGANATFPTWHPMALAEGFMLYCHPNLKVTYQSPRMVLLGYVWQVDPDCPDPATQLRALESQAEITTRQVMDIEQSWCGRYLLIVDLKVYLDACGLINLFYSPDTCSSSLNVLCQAEGRELIYPPIEHRKSPDFVPGMMTPYEGVRRLMPSQILDLRQRVCIPRPLLASPIPVFANEQEGIDTLAHYFLHSGQQLAQTFAGHDIWVASTSGRDSRTTIALLHKAGVKFNTFTLWHENISDADCVIPARIAKTLHLHYRFVKRCKSQFSQARHDAYRRHTAGMAVDEDWRFYAYNQYPALRETERPIVLLRSGIWGIANEYYHRKYGARGSDLTVIYPEIKRQEFLNVSIREWDDYVRQDQLNTNINYVDRIYWELREASWLASVEQSFDVMDGISSIQVFNCRTLIGILLGFPMEDRMKKEEENKITSAACPALDAVLYDYQYDALPLQRLKQKYRKYSHMLVCKIKRLCGLEY